MTVHEDDLHFEPPATPDQPHIRLCCLPDAGRCAPENVFSFTSVANVQHSIAEALADSPAADLLRRLDAARAAIRTISPAIEAIAPGADLSGPAAGEIRDHVLYLTTSAALAAKLRQAAPRLLDCLQRSGSQVSEIRFRIQPKRSIYYDQGSANPPEDTNGLLSAIPARRPQDVSLALACFEQLNSRLPDSALRRAVARLQRTLRARLERTA